MNKNGEEFKNIQLSNESDHPPSSLPFPVLKIASHSFDEWMELTLTDNGGGAGRWLIHE
jgi:hypothetical protein